jgi:type II secretory pathway component PulJ
MRAVLRAARKNLTRFRLDARGNPVSEEGFGLMEVLIVLMITGAMATVMMSMLSQFRPLREKGDQVVSIDTLQSALRHVVHSLESAELMVLPAEDEKDRGFYLDGKSADVRFLAVVRRGALTSGLSDVRFFVDRAGGASRLVRQIRDRRTSGNPVVQEVTIAENIQSFRLTYASAGNPAKSPDAWPAQWRAKGRLPDAIGVRLVQSGGREPITLSAIAVPFAR